MLCFPHSYPSGTTSHGRNWENNNYKSKIAYFRAHEKTCPLQVTQHTVKFRKYAPGLISFKGPF